MQNMVRDIRWLEKMADGLAAAREAKKPVVLKPAGQGMDDSRTQWCPAATQTRALSFSDPAVAHLIGNAFVPVAFSMNLWGPGRDDEARTFVMQHPANGLSDLYPQDLFVVDPEGALLGRLRFDADPAETLAFLKDILRQRPDLAPAEGPDAYDLPAPTLPGELALDELQRRYDQGDRAALVAKLEAWLDQYEETLPQSAVLARVLLGGARYHAGDFDGADAAWGEVIQLYPDSPLRHRAYYNRVEQGSFPSVPHPDVAGRKPPPISRRGIIVPNAAVRERNMADVESNRRYQMSSPGLPFVLIAPGTFTMGGTPAVQARELPVRRVTLTRPYLIAAWPVTNRVWSRFRPGDVLEGDETGLAGDLPIVGVSWDDAQEFCGFLSRQEGRKYRLPTEAEWEFAARGGLDSKMFPWGDEPATPEKCNYVNPRPVPVGCYPPNGYGLFDMVGNNFEWTGDFYLKDAFARTASEVTDPAGPTAEDVAAYSPDGARARVVRSGGWMSNEMSKVNCHTSWRLGWPEDFNWGNIGFRLVTEVD